MVKSYRIKNKELLQLSLMTTIPLGALHKLTGKYIYPGKATKDSEYVCPECNRDLILVKGVKRVHHFRHKVNHIKPCMHYDSPGESQIHKDAKLLLKTMLENGVQINILRNCVCCKNNETFEIPVLSDSSQIQLEYRFEHDGPKVADVAYLDGGEIVCIFEICHTHATSANNRPEPWFEINATALIMDANSQENIKNINIMCIRLEKCEECIIQKQQAIDKLCEWLNTGNEIAPFYKYIDAIGNYIVENNVTVCDEHFDVGINFDTGNDFIYERYGIRLINMDTFIYHNNPHRYAQWGVWCLLY